MSDRVKRLADELKEAQDELFAKEKELDEIEEKNQLELDAQEAKIRAETGDRLAELEAIVANVDQDKADNDAYYNQEIENLQCVFELGDAFDF